MDAYIIRTNERGDRDVIVDTIEELDVELDRLWRLHRSQPIVIEIIKPNRDVMSIGVGADPTIIHFTPAQGGPSMLSVGKQTADPHEHVVFLYGGQWTGIYTRHLVPESLARQEIKGWFQNGVLPGLVRWTADK